VEAPGHGQLDVLDNAALAAFLKGSRPQTVLNLAAWADVDGAETNRAEAYRLNVSFPRQLAELCGELNDHLIHVSTDYVFDGTNADRPYREDDPTNPLCWYADTKLQGERAILETNPKACVARIEMPFTGRQHPKRDLARLIVSRLRAGQPIQGVMDQRITPVFLDDAADALLLLIRERYIGLIHVAGSHWTTPYEFARWIARRLELDTELIQPEPFARFAATRPARRPQHSWLDVSRFTSLFPGVLRPVEDELDAWANQLEAVASRAT
jgi:dTDP-4-dehydrorhamnose reductase